MPFDFGKLLQDPSFVYGMNLLGSRGTANPYANAQTAVMKLQELQQTQALQEAQAAEQRALAAGHQQTAETTTLKNALLREILKQEGMGSALPGQPQMQGQGIQPADMGPGASGLAIPGVPRGYNGQGQSVNLFNGFATPGYNKIGMEQTQQAPTQEGPPFSRVNPYAKIFALAGEPKLAEFYQESQKPIVTRDGAVLLPNPDGSYRIATGSLEAQQAIERMRESTKAEQELVTVPVEGKGDVQMTRLQASAYYNTGQLPPQLQQRMGGAPTQQGTQTGTANEFNVPAKLLDNLRQTESSGNRFALNKQTKAMGPYQFLPETIIAMHKEGIEFNPLNEQEARSAAAQYLSKLYKKTGSWEKALAAYGGFVTKNPSQYVEKNMQGVNAEPVAPQAAGRIGFKTSPQDQAQLTQTSETWGKFNMGAQEAAVTAGGKINNISALESQLDKIPRTGWNAAAELGWNKLLSSMGFPTAKYASNIEAAQALSKSLALEMRDPKDGGGSPGQISNFETRLFQQMVASPDKLRESNKIMIQAYKRKQERKVEIAKIYAQYASTHGGIVDQGVMPQIVALTEKKPLFTEAEARTINRETVGSTSLGNRSGSGPNNAVGGRIKGLPSEGPRFLGFE